MVTDNFEGNLQSMMERCGTNVIYEKFVASSGNLEVTNELKSEEAAYPDGEHKTLKALIELAPSQALRTKLGLSEDVAAVLTLTVFDLTRLAITVTTKDRFALPGYDRPFYVEKVIPTAQSRGRWYEYMIALSKKTGGKRNL